MKITNSLTDAAVLAELGSRLARRRLSLQMTQAQLAEQAGIGKRTLERMEAGEASQLDTLVRVLRVLEALAGLDTLLPEAETSPMDLLKRGGKQRQRASGSRSRNHSKHGSKSSGEQSAEEAWQWGEDS